MDDQDYGKRDKRGNWKPDQPLENAPVFVFPPQPLKFLKWLPHYFLPWNLLFMVLAAVFWFFLTPDKETMKTLSVGWIVFILLRNAAVILLIHGALEVRLYIRRAQGRDSSSTTPSGPVKTPARRLCSRIKISIV